MVSAPAVAAVPTGPTALGLWAVTISVILAIMKAQFLSQSFTQLTLCGTVLGAVQLAPAVPSTTLPGS